jgi:hypothetical protein
MAKTSEDAQAVLDQQVGQAPEIPESMKEDKKTAKEEAKIEKEAKALGVANSRVSLTGFKEKSNPAKLEKEQKRQDKLKLERTQARVEKAKAKSKQKPIEERRLILISRLRASRDEGKKVMRARAYTDKNIKAWIEELELIENNPKQWNRSTKNGTAPYVPGNKRKKSTQEILDGMNLDD